jgi:hypothetical protein
MNAAPESTPKSRRDELSALVERIWLDCPDLTLAEKCRAAATIALAHLYVADADHRLEDAHRERRERALVKALAEALQIVEQISVDLAADIAIELEQDVAPLSGKPLVLVCGGIEAEIVPLIPEVQ